MLQQVMIMEKSIRAVLCCDYHSMEKDMRYYVFKLGEVPYNDGNLFPLLVFDCQMGVYGRIDEICRKSANRPTDGVITDIKKLIKNYPKGVRSDGSKTSRSF